MRVGLPHLGQSVLLVVSMTFFRSAVFAILAPTAMARISWVSNVRAANPRLVAAAYGSILLKSFPGLE
jgi:hypothetical protein